MDLLYERCAGLDVHATTVVACARIASSGPVRYSYLTGPLLAIRAHATTVVACTSNPAHRSYNRSIAASSHDGVGRGVPRVRNLQGALTGEAGGAIHGARGP